MNLNARNLLAQRRSHQTLSITEYMLNCLVQWRGFLPDAPVIDESTEANRFAGLVLTRDDSTVSISTEEEFSAAVSVQRDSLPPGASSVETPSVGIAHQQSHQLEELTSREKLAVALIGLGLDIEALMHQVETLWANVKRGSLSFMAASAATTVAIRCVKVLVAQIQIGHPSLSTAADFYTAVETFKLEDATSTIEAMGQVRTALRGFSHVPTSNEVFVLQEGMFGPEYLELVSPL